MCCCWFNWNAEIQLECWDSIGMLRFNPSVKVQSKCCGTDVWYLLTVEKYGLISDWSQWVWALIDITKGAPVLPLKHILFFIINVIYGQRHSCGWVTAVSDRKDSSVTFSFSKALAQKQSFPCAIMQMSDMIQDMRQDIGSFLWWRRTLHLEVWESRCDCWFCYRSPLLPWAGNLIDFLLFSPVSLALSMRIWSCSLKIYDKRAPKPLMWVLPQWHLKWNALLFTFQPQFYLWSLYSHRNIQDRRNSNTLSPSNRLFIIWIYFQGILSFW